MIKVILVNLVDDLLMKYDAFVICEDWVNNILLELKNRLQAIIPESLWHPNLLSQSEDGLPVNFEDLSQEVEHFKVPQVKKSSYASPSK